MTKGKYEDLSRRRYGRLRVIRDSGNRCETHVVWVCHCEPAIGGCGSYSLVTTNNLNSGNTLSCGCLQREIAALPNRRRPAWRRHLKEDSAGKNPL